MSSQVPERYLVDAGGNSGSAEAFFLPADEAELCGLMRQASASCIPVTVSGARTGLAGGGVPAGGWAISLERFRHLEVRQGSAVVGVGVTLEELLRAASPSGQFFGPDPTEQSASLGGMIATNASGSRSFRYGSVRRHVQALRMVFMDGEARTFERGQTAGFAVDPVRQPATTKHAAGFPLFSGMDAVDLFTGSEGTLGVVVGAQLQLLPAPGELLSGVVFFASDAEALEAVEAWRAIPGLRMLEYLDAGSLRLLGRRYEEIPRAARAALMVEEEYGETGEPLSAWGERLADSVALAGDCWFALGARERERFRRFRHALPECVNTLMRGRGLAKLGTDFAVPIVRNREMMGTYRESLDSGFGDEYVIFGHIGDAHVHCNLLPRDEGKAREARRIVDVLASKAVALGGTVAAEHGLGKRKAHLLRLQYTDAEIEAMMAVKRRLDPLGLLGRGTLLPEPRAAGGPG